MSFIEGQRVMCTNFDSPHKVNLTGYFGRVLQTEPKTFGKGSMVLVELVGCLPSAPDVDDLAQVLSEKPWPFYDYELEAAD